MKLACPTCEQHKAGWGGLGWGVFTGNNLDEVESRTVTTRTIRCSRQRACHCAYTQAKRHSGLSGHWQPATAVPSSIRSAGKKSCYLEHSKLFHSKQCQMYQPEPYLLGFTQLTCATTTMICKSMNHISPTKTRETFEELAGVEWRTKKTDVQQQQGLANRQHKQVKSALAVKNIE
jgi:hypothetical protein